jgi:cyclophilin family peptidyl-prolyl cis-trans isomerase
MIPLVLVILWLAQPSSTSNTSGPLAGLGPGKFMVLDTSKGQIIAKLHTDASANVSKTIANFETKAAQKYFDGLKFHRVEDWVIQGGDPLGNGTGGGEMPSEYNSLPFVAGALGVARGGDPAINNDSQFFITKSDANYLNTQYTNWGQVVKGMDVVNLIAIGDTITTMTIQENK